MSMFFTGLSGTYSCVSGVGSWIPLAENRTVHVAQDGSLVACRLEGSSWQTMYGWSLVLTPWIPTLPPNVNKQFSAAPTSSHLIRIVYRGVFNLLPHPHNLNYVIYFYVFYHINPTGCYFSKKKIVIYIFSWCYI